MANRIQDNAKELKLVYLREYYEQELIRANAGHLSYEEFLDGLLEKEIETRRERAVKNPH